MRDQGNSKPSELSLSALDFSHIQFASDHLTVLALRKMHPALFDQGFNSGDAAQPRYFLTGSQPGHASDGVGDLLFCERLIAAGAYAQSLGIPAPRGWDIEHYKGLLNSSYCRYGLATGEHQAAEMIRDIERQADRLAIHIAR